MLTTASATLKECERTADALGFVGFKRLRRRQWSVRAIDARVDTPALDRIAGLRPFGRAHMR